MRPIKNIKRPLNINQFIAVVFLIIIIVGTVLLSLPIASRSGSSLGVKTALFTATSSTCVTGLVLGDTYTLWSGFGQAVILCLIEVGGLGFISLATSVVYAFRKKADMSTSMAIAQSLGSDSMGGALLAQKRIVFWCLTVESIGAFILTIRFLKDFKFLIALKLGIFHSVSAFCNAGFDILGFIKPNGSITPYATDPTVSLTIAFLIIIGGMGFLVWDEIFKVRKFKKLSVYSKLVILTTLVLVLGGTAILCITEWNNTATLGNMNSAQKVLCMFFQSVTTRTAGFAGIDQGAMTEGSKAVSILLMLIGGSSGSTAGGLKTVTFIVLVLFLYSRLRGRKTVTVYYRTVSSTHVLNALTIFGIMITLIFTGGTVISALSGFSFTDTLFESVSALSTVGLTTGITSKIGTFSQILMIIYMYFGRVGILTLSFGFLRNSPGENKYKYAETKLLIG